MHELGLVQSLIRVVTESASTNGITQVARVNVVVGRDALVLPAALLFAFGHLKREPLSPDAELVIEERTGRELFVDYYEGEP